MTSPVLEMLLLSITAKFPFLTMDYSPWSSKNLIDRNQLKKILQGGIDVTCMYTNFGGHDLSGFGDTAKINKIICLTRIHCNKMKVLIIMSLRCNIYNNVRNQSEYN